MIETDNHPGPDLAAFLLGAGTVSAVGVPLVNPGVGVKAGVNLSNLELTGGATNNRTGFVGGAFGQYPLSELFTIQLEALYSQKGFQRASLGGVSDWDMKSDYLEFPLTVAFEIPMPNLKPYFYAGVSWNILMASEIQNSETGGEWVDNKDGLKSSTVNLVLGLGLRFGSFNVDARINHGNGNLIASDTSDLEVFDRTISLTAGYVFSI